MPPANIAVRLRDVLLFSRRAGTYHTNARSFASLAYRLDDAKSKYIYCEKKLYAHTNHISYVPPELAYDQTGSDSRAIVFHFDVFGSFLGEIEVYEFADYETYKVLFQKALAIWDGREPGYQYRATAVLYEILAAMQQGCAALDAPGGDFVAQTKDYIDAHFADSSLTVQQLADRAYVSSAYLRRRFHEVYHVSPKEYLDAVRLQYARSLLQTGYYTQADVAARCGYRDVKYFRTLFSRKCGQSISTYCRDYWK